MPHSTITPWRARYSGFVFAAILVSVASVNSAHAQATRDDFSMRDGELIRRQVVWSLRAVDIPDHIAQPLDYDAFITNQNAAANAGAQTIVFDLFGFSEDGTSIDKAAARHFRNQISIINGRRFAAVIRVVGEDWPADPKTRQTLATTAGKTFKRTRAAVYLFEGDDCADLVKRFKQEAGQCVTAADEGGDITFVREVGDSTEKGIHYFLPFSKESLARYEAAARRPVELAPWTPDNSVLSKEERDEGFIALFDGKTFNGWSIMGDPAGWEVADGEIRFVRPGGGEVLSRNRYSDYVLRLEFKISDGGNSGVHVHAPRTARESRIGMESQIMGDFGVEPNVHCTGAIYDVIAPKGNWVKPAGEWNTLEITLNGSKFQNKINGKVAVEVDMDTHEKLRLRNREGFIGLQDHDNHVAFRNIRIKEL